MLKILKKTGCFSLVCLTKVTTFANRFLGKGMNGSGTIMLAIPFVKSHQTVLIKQLLNMSADVHHQTVSGLGGEVLKETGVNVNKCYQCGKCTAGCPLASEMEFTPSYIMRMLQTGDPKLEDQVLCSFTIWACLTCEMCYARCPKSIDLPKVMDFLREKSLKENKVSPKAKEIVAFHKSFLSSIEKTGRLYELGLTLEYKARTFSLMQDVAVAPAMLSRGKLHIVPEIIKGKAAVASIFDKTIRKNKK